MSVSPQETSSEYTPSVPASPGTLSMDSEGSDDNYDSETSDAERDEDDDVTAIELETGRDKKHAYPPNTLAALVVGVDADDPEGDIIKAIQLSNPFQSDLVNATLAQLNSPNADKRLIYIDLINYFEYDKEKREEILNVAMNDEGWGKMVVERYADLKVTRDLQAGLIDIDFPIAQQEVKDLILSCSDTVEAGERLRYRLLRQLDIYAMMAPRHASAKVKHGAMTALCSIGETVLAAPSNLGAGLLKSDAVGMKISLVFRKIFTELRSLEDKRRFLGHVKRVGLAARIKQLIEDWKPRGSMGDTEWMIRMD